MIYSWKKIVLKSIPLLTLCILIEIFAGQMLQGGFETLTKFSIFLISIPVINGVGGNIGSVLGARIASGLHVGYIKLDVRDENMRNNLITSILMGVIVYFVLAIIIYLTASFWGNAKGIEPMKFISIIVGAGVLLVCFISFISVFTAFYSFKRGLDPDDTVSPIVTTLGDTFGIMFLFLLIGVIL